MVIAAETVLLIHDTYFVLFLSVVLYNRLSPEDEVLVNATTGRPAVLKTKYDEPQQEVLIAVRTANPRCRDD